MTDHSEYEPMTAEQARANHPSRTGSPAVSRANLGTSAEQARQLAPPDADLSFEGLATSALDADEEFFASPDVVKGLAMIHRATAATFERAYAASQRLAVGRDEPPARIVADISIMIEQGTGADPEKWAPLAAYAIYELIKREQAEPADGETSGLTGRRLADAVAAYGAAMVAGETSRAARLWTEIVGG